ncbi:MAG TPA: hypothetical protein VJT09_11375 [Pyrinomonadaceae bacterium]|nr:hypothetical protein [Pyrinomonadaceae bacterium]
MATSYINDEQPWFAGWLHRAWPRMYQFIFNKIWLGILPAINLLAIFGFISGFVLTLKDTHNRPKYLLYVNDIGHIILLLATWFFFLPRLGIGRSNRSQEGDAVTKTVVNFKDWLHLLLIFWLLFYICRAIVDSSKAYPNGIHRENLAAYADYISIYIHTLSALAFFGLYISAEYVGISGWSADGRIWFLIGIIIIGWTLQLLAHGAEPPLDEFNLLAGIINGLIVGIAIALLIGRLDSKYIGLNKAVVTILYCYALIQPLFPYIFQNPTENTSNLRANMQYSFVAMALVMKSVFLLSVGKIIDTGTLHFYISSVQWVDKHAATLQSLHQRALTSGSSSTQRGPYLFSLVPPAAFYSAKIRIEKLDIRTQLGVLNAWIGVGWDIKDFKAKEVQISEVKFQIKVLRIIDMKSVRVPEDDKFTQVELDIDLDVTSTELKERLKSDQCISEAIKKEQKTEQVNVILIGLEAHTSIVDDRREPQYIWHRLESPDLENRLFYKATLELEDLK